MAENEMRLSRKGAFSAASAALTARTEIVSKLLDEVGGLEAFNQHFKGVGVYKELTPSVAQLYISIGVTTKENLYNFIRDNHANKGNLTLTDCQSVSDKKLSDYLEKPLTVVSRSLLWAANIVSEGNKLEYATFVHDPVQNINQLGGTMIVDKQGKLLYLHKSIYDRHSPDAVVQEVAKLNAILNNDEETKTGQRSPPTKCKC